MVGGRSRFGTALRSGYRRWVWPAAQFFEAGPKAAQQASHGGNRGRPMSTGVGNHMKWVAEPGKPAQIDGKFVEQSLGMQAVLEAAGAFFLPGKQD